MKKLFTSLMLLCTVAVFAQENGIKINTFSMAIGNLGVHYERVINDKSSFQVGATFLLPTTGVFGVNFDDEAQNVEITDVKLSGFGLHGEYRMYTAQDAPDGFYWGPWARYYKYSVSDERRIDGYKHESSVGLGSFSVGLQIGYQWIISDRVAIDWTFLGLGVNRMNIFGKYETNDPSYTMEDIEGEYEDIAFVGSRVKVEQDGNGFKINAPFLSSAFKSTFRIGVFF